MGGGLEQYTATGAVSVAVSRSVADELQRYYSGIKPLVIPIGIDVKHFSKRDRAHSRQKYGLEANDFVVCFTGRFSLFGKGFAELHALALLAWEAKLRVKFLIATNEIPAGWPANVVFAKNVNYENMPELYSAANVFVFPTRYEGCSYSLLEAMACELPVLTTQVGYAKDLYRDIKEITPYILKENDVEQYWKRLKQFAQNEELAEGIGVIGAEYVRRYNSMERMVDSYATLIEQVTTGKFIYPD
jgi:glycosyltransferase involved in cell wall biosynthesis